MNAEEFKAVLTRFDATLTNMARRSLNSEAAIKDVQTLIDVLRDLDKHRRAMESEDQTTLCVTCDAPVYADYENLCSTCQRLAAIEKHLGEVEARQRAHFKRPHGGVVKM